MTSRPWFRTDTTLSLARYPAQPHFRAVGSIATLVRQGWKIKSASPPQQRMNDLSEIMFSPNQMRAQQMDVLPFPDFPRNQSHPVPVPANAIAHAAKNPPSDVKSPLLAKKPPRLNLVVCANVSLAAQPAIVFHNPNPLSVSNPAL
jgi:hypothetical protein